MSFRGARGCPAAAPATETGSGGQLNTASFLTWPRELWAGSPSPAPPPYMGRVDWMIRHWNLPKPPGAVLGEHLPGKGLHELKPHRSVSEPDLGAPRGGAQRELRRAGHRREPAPPSGLLSLQRCLVQVAFRPVLPTKLILQEALQTLTKEAEVKSVRGDMEEKGVGHRLGG